MTVDMTSSDENQLETRQDLVNTDEEDDEFRLTLSSISSSDQQSSSTTTTNMNHVETFNDKELNKLYDEWFLLDSDLRAFEPNHKDYVRKLDEVESLKSKYKAELLKYQKKVDQLQKDLNRLRKSHSVKDDEKKKKIPVSSSNQLKSSHSSANLTSSKDISNVKADSSSNLRSLAATASSPSFDKPIETLTPLERLELISNQLTANSLFLTRISNTLPNKDPYLKVILGGVDVSILNKADKWTYKQEYEKFKFIVTCISLVSSLVIWSLTSRFRAFDAMFHFLLVWYYCTLTIRESILIVNGSNINLWWRTHHFIATVATGILLTWPDSPSYQSFRTQFFVFSFYLSVVQGLQFYYQRGCLYRLRALGETHDMDITIEGFHRWMFRGLSFLVPFLLVGYIFQLFNAYTLWKLAHEENTHEWQVYVLSIIFFVLSLGNILTTLSVLREKLREKARPTLLRQKYQSFKEYLATSYHRRSRSFNQLRCALQNYNDEDQEKTPSKEE